MIKLGDALIGGCSADNTIEYKTATVLGLNSKAKRMRKYSFGDWEVELSGSNFIVARTSLECCSSDLASVGYDVCEKALDLYSREGNGNHFITEPQYRHIDFYTANGERFLNLYDIENIAVDMTCEITVTDKDGNIIQPQAVPQSVWQPIFRYYRFSQTSSNVYDGYRWMYLVFEMLMQSIEPIKLKANGKPAEGERQWLYRALTFADNNYKWVSSVSWSQSNCIDYFLTAQYDSIRCELFHAKGGHIMPNEQIGQQLVNKMFLELQELCLHLLSKLYPIRGRSGVMTYQGFNLMMKSYYPRTTAYISALPVPQGYINGTTPLDENAVILNRTRDVPLLLPGIAECIYSIDLLPENTYLIRNYGINQNRDVLVYSNLADDVLELYRIDGLSIHFYNRLVNQGEMKRFQ